MNNPAAIERCVVSRHNFTPVRAPRNFNLSSQMPGAINVGLSGGHVETAPLETLWQYSWHMGWVTPGKRPGS
jgi:hypothetical protein